MEKFTRVIAKEDIKTFDDAGIAQYGNLNKIIEELNTVDTDLSGLQNQVDIIDTDLTNLTNVVNNIINNPSGPAIVTITYPDLLLLISGDDLIPGTLYKITGFNKNIIGQSILPEILYDDGTDSGITIYMRALTTNKLASKGCGEFYNPKYTDANAYYNTDGTGLYQIWDGNNSDYPGNIPTYAIGDVVFWGGYAWENITGSVGSYDDLMILNALDWSKLPYSNTTYYQKVIDEIEVDWDNGIVVARRNAANNITVKFDASSYWAQGLNSTYILPAFGYNPIAYISWGLYGSTSNILSGNIYGISNITAINSIIETVNFKGKALLNIYAYGGSFFDSNYIGCNANIADINLYNKSKFQGNTLNSDITISATPSILNINIKDSSEFYSCTLLSTCDIQLIDLYQESKFYGNILASSTTIKNNFCTVKSSIYNNVLTSNSQIMNNLLYSNSAIFSNTLSLLGYVNNNLLNNFSTVNNCKINGVGILGAGIAGCNFQGISSFSINNATSIYFSLTTSSFFNSTLNLSSTTPANLTSKVLDKLQLNNVGTLTPNLNTATVIFDSNPFKNVFRNSAGTVRLSYTNASDVLTVVNINL